MKNVFHLSQKLFPFLRYLNFCSDFFDHVGKGLSKKAEVTFKICEVMEWTTNNCNTQIAKYLKK